LKTSFLQAHEELRSQDTAGLNEALLRAFPGSSAAQHSTRGTPRLQAGSVFEALAAAASQALL